MSMETSRNGPRLSTACNFCRRRKRRCDGLLPCSLCKTKSLDCQYSPQLDRRRPPSARLVESLRKRIEVLESNDSSTSVSPAHDHAPEVEVGLEEGAFGPGRLFFGLRFGENGELEYRGPTSSLPEPKLHEHANSSPPLLVHCPETTGNMTKTVSSNFILPSLELIQQFLDIFLEWQNSSIIILPGSLVEVILNEYTNGAPTPARRMLLLAIISLTRKILNRPGEDPQLASAESEACFMEAKVLLLDMAFSSPVLETVQTACILACREYGCGRENSAWVMNGIMATTGSILGLHVGRDFARWVAAGYFSPAVVEGRIIAHWASVMIDRVLACCLGRHCLIHPDDFNTPLIQVRLPMALGSLRNSKHPVLIEGSSTHGDSVSSTFHYAVELWGLSDRALTEIYDFQHDVFNTKEFYANLKHIPALVAKHRVIVLEWQHKLPSVIQLQKSQPLTHLLSLHMTFNSLMILMHRPFLCWHGPSKASIEKTTLKDSSVPGGNLFGVSAAICTSSAFEITNLIRSYQQHYTLGVINFSVVHYLVNASTIHIVNSESDDTELATSASKAYKICIDALLEISNVWEVAQKAIVLLEQLIVDRHDVVQKRKDKKSSMPVETLSSQKQPEDIAFGTTPKEEEFYTSNDLGDPALLSLAAGQSDLNPGFWINFVEFSDWPLGSSVIQ